MCAQLTLLVMLPCLGTAVGDDWPQWMRPGRDSIWSEKGVAKKFPKEGPKVLWRVPINLGYGGPAVANGTVCLDARTGKEIWAVGAEVDYELSDPSGPAAPPRWSMAKSMRSARWDTSAVTMPRRAT